MNYDRHLHWEVTAFTTQSLSGTLFDAVFIVVLGYMCEADAIAAARELVKRENYRISRVWECNTCAFQKNMAETFEKSLS